MKAYTAYEQVARGSFAIIGFHKRYNIGDVHQLEALPRLEDVMDTFKERARAGRHAEVMTAPLYMYDHGMTALSLYSFIGRAHHAEWDSGVLGFVAWRQPRGADTAYYTSKIEKALGEYADYLNGSIEEDYREVLA